MQITEMKVDGMTCDSCVASVIKALRRATGVQDVEVDLGAGIAHVRGEHPSSWATQHDQYKAHHPQGSASAAASIESSMNPVATVQMNSKPKVETVAKEVQNRGEEVRSTLGRQPTAIVRLEGASHVL